MANGKCASGPCCRARIATVYRHSMLWRNTFAICLLPFAFCHLPFAICLLPCLSSILAGSPQSRNLFQQRDWHSAAKRLTESLFDDSSMTFLAVEFCPPS